jgi:hypothetical protein
MESGCSAASSHDTMPWLMEAKSASEPSFMWREYTVAATDQNKGLYDHLYQRFFEDRDRHQGYEFQNAPSGSAPTPVVTFRQKLRWWTWDRWQRRKKILAERDRLQREIIEIKKPSSHL